METVTLPKTKYQILKKQASLYEKIFRYSPERIFGTEIYSEKRIKEFLKEDRLNRETKNYFQKLLRSL